ncbi:hypothetical protein ACTQ29_08355 [Bifidobacterium boum]|uniref:hypothetical protein n=2 Tax=Bacteria TaxID=2 RepID=UPI003F925845
MMVGTVLSVLAIMVSPVVAWLVARAGQRSTQRSAEITSATDLVPDLISRVERLEQQVHALQSELSERLGQLSAAAWFIDQVGMLRRPDWGRMPRVPHRIRDHIDPSLWLDPDPVDDTEPSPVRED